jgi:ABC-2 type transport system ATP-binding protein
METVIEVEDLSKVFYNKKSDKEIWAVDNISFSIQKGEIFGLLGPNGAGKTTTIRLIAGLLHSTTGNITVLKRNVKEEAHNIRKDLGFLPETHGSYENLSLYENLEFFGSFYDIDNLNKAILTILADFGLLERKDMKVGKLSKGQKQRLAIARAIIHDPTIMFFDEPTSGLDPKASVGVRDLILNLKQKNRTIFINSHNLEEVQKLCDRVAILDEGKIKRIGTPKELGKELWDSQEVICTLKSPVSDEMKTALSQLDLIEQFRAEKKTLYIYTEDSNEATPQIVKTLVDYNAQILEVRRTVRSLEDIYLKLMSNENKQEVEF